MNNPIGILDSGIGGLSIWREIVSLLPQESTLYIADSKNCPYGPKSEEEVYKLARRLVEFLVKKECKVIVIACNTITVSCLDKLRSEFNLPIIGTVPVVKTASESSKNKKIGILSTTRTAESEYQKKLIKQFAGDCEVITIGTDKIVPLIEIGELGNMGKVLKEVLEPLRRAEIDTLALGCSHFPLIKEQIQQALGSSVKVLDSGAAIARQTKRILENNDILSKSRTRFHKFYTTGNLEQFRMVTQKLITEEEHVEKINL